MYNNLPTNDIRVTNISKSSTYKIAAETSWHREGTKLRHCHPMYSHRLPDKTRRSCLCRVRLYELSLETVWQSLNS